MVRVRKAVFRKTNRLKVRERKSVYVKGREREKCGKYEWTMSGCLPSTFSQVNFSKTKRLSQFSEIGNWNLKGKIVENWNSAAFPLGDDHHFKRSPLLGLINRSKWNTLGDRARDPIRPGEK